MGHGHSHGGPPPHVEIGQLARNSLVGFLAALGILALLGVIWHWPTSSEVSEVIKLPGQVEGVTYADAKITGFSDCPDVDPSQLKCTMVDATITNGENKGTEVTIEITGPVVEAGLTQGDSIEVAQFPNDGGYAFSNVNRGTVLVVMGLLFLVAVVAVARLRGLLALVGLILAGVVLVRFMLPAILIGKPGMVVALAGSTAIMFVVLYVAHGVSWRTTAALAGTMLGLALTTGLGVLSVQAARLTGFADDNEIGLAQLAPNLNFRDLFMVGIIVGGLGVLNDVTITQASAVWELRAAAPEWSRRRVFASGMRIGRDHIASTIYTIVFAYAGSALTVLLMLYFTNRDALAMLNVELFAGEAVRTLGSAIGLILSVPITTGIAALIVGQARPREEEPAAELGVSANDAAYQIGVDGSGIRAQGTRQTLGSQATVIAATTSTTSSLVMLTAPLERLPDGSFSDESLLTELSGRLGALLTSAERSGVVAAIDPDLYDAAVALAQPHTVGGEERDGSGVASSWVSRVDALAAKGSLRRLPYGNPDLQRAQVSGELDSVLAKDDGDTHSPDKDHPHADEHVAEDPYAADTPGNPYARPAEEYVEPTKPRRGV